MRAVILSECDTDTVGATDGSGTAEVPIKATTEQAVLVCREALSLLLSPSPNIPDAAREAVLAALDISDDYARACVDQLDKAFPHDGNGWQ